MSKITMSFLKKQRITAYIIVTILLLSGFAFIYALRLPYRTAFSEFLFTASLMLMLISLGFSIGFTLLFSRVKKEYYNE